MRTTKLDKFLAAVKRVLPEKIHDLSKLSFDFTDDEIDCDGTVIGRYGQTVKTRDDGREYIDKQFFVSGGIAISGFYAQAGVKNAKTLFTAGKVKEEYIQFIY